MGSLGHKCGHFPHLSTDLSNHPMRYVDTHIHIPVQKHRQVPVQVPVEKPVEVNVIETTEKARACACVVGVAGVPQGNSREMGRSKGKRGRFFGVEQVMKQRDFG